MTVNLGVKVIPPNNRIFLFYSLSFICWYISSLHFKTFKVYFLEVPPFHYVLVCKIHGYMQTMILSSLLTLMSCFYIKFANFWYITCFVLNLIPIWSRSHGGFFLSGGYGSFTWITEITHRCVLLQSNYICYIRTRR